MSIFRDFTAFFGQGVGTISGGGAMARFGNFVGLINSINQTFVAPEILGVTKNDFKVFYNGVLLDVADYTFVAPNIIQLISIVPAPPDRQLEYLLLGTT